MKLLFVKPKHIGDALIMTPSIEMARRAYPEAEIWVVVRDITQGILQGCTAIDRVLTTDAPEKEQQDGAAKGGMWSLLRELRRQRFDVAFDLSDSDRGRWLVLLSGARRRVCDAGTANVRRWWRLWFEVFEMPVIERKKQHKAEKDALVVRHGLKLDASTPPLQFDAARDEPWPSTELHSPWIVMHPATRWKRKEWPDEKWVALGRWWIDQGYQVVISVGPDQHERTVGARLLAGMGDRALCTDGSASWAQLAWLLRHARQFVGVDTAAMHLAAACQCPTVALFGPSIPIYWRPWQVRHRLVFAPGEDADERQATVAVNAETAITADIQVEAVIATCESLLAASSTTP